MHKAIPEEQLRENLDQIVREVTETSTGIVLTRGEAPPREHICTVHIGFRRGFHSSLSLRADAALFIRLAQAVLEKDRITAQDMEDVAKEYLNVLCGHIATALYRTTRVSARFSVPSFHWGSYSPEGHREQFVIRYSGGRNQAAELIHYVPVPLEGDNGGT